MTRITHNSVFAAHRLKCRPANAGRHFPFLKNRIRKPGTQETVEVAVSAALSVRGRAFTLADQTDLSCGGRRLACSAGCSLTAQAWRGKVTDDYVRKQVVSDPHSPRQFRVIGPSRNTDAWYDSFKVESTDKMFVPPDQRVRIW